ncbi:MAG: hypothetical protein ACXIUQ_05655 [Cecembia sp.]
MKNVSLQWRWEKTLAPFFQIGANELLTWYGPSSDAINSGFVDFYITVKVDT